ncbi:FHA domain-containing protein [Magnetococcales bacterium HHB-1]
MIFGRGKKKAPPRIDLEDYINASGRVDYEFLESLAKSRDKKTFSAIVRRPVLMGSRLFQGLLSSNVGDEGATLQFFSPSKDMSNTEPDKGLFLDQAVYPLMKTGWSESANASHYSVGRSNKNDLTMADYAISNRHARIEKVGTGYFICDNGSTNGTKVNGIEVQKDDQIELADGDEVAFGRFLFTFLYPAALYMKICGDPELDAQEEVAQVQLQLEDRKQRQVLFTPTRRLDYSALKQIIQNNSMERFCKILTLPVFIGTGLLRGRAWSIQADSNPDETLHIHFSDESEKRGPVKMKALERAIFPLLKNRNSRFEKGNYLVGRGNKDGPNPHDVMINDPSISGEHALVRLGQGSYYLEDLRSTNGTALNDEVLTPSNPRKLVEGDEVRFGRYVFTFLFPKALYNRLKHRFESDA